MKRSSARKLIPLVYRLMELKGMTEEQPMPTMNAIVDKKRLGKRKGIKRVIETATYGRGRKSPWDEDTDEREKCQ